MNRRSFTLGFYAVSGAIALPVSGSARRQSHSLVPESSWQTAQGEFSVEWDASLFQSPSEPHGGSTETLILRAEGVRNLLNIWVSLLEGSLTSTDEIRDYIENDPDLMYGLDGTDNQRTAVIEENDAFGVLYRPVFEGRINTWSYEEFWPLADHPGKAVHVWVNGSRQEFDRSAIDAAISSVSINGEELPRAIALDDLLNHIENMPVVIP